MPGHRRLMVVAAAVVLLVAAVVVAISAGGRDGGATAGGSGRSTPGSGAQASGTGGKAGVKAGGKAGGEGTQQGTETRSDDPPATGPVRPPKPASQSGARKIAGVGPKGELTPVTTEAGPGTTLAEGGSAATKKGPLVSKPLPKTRSSRGRLVRGYPSDVLPVIPGSRVRSSSVSSSPQGVQVAFTGSAPSTAQAVAAYYRLALAPYGFTEAAVPAVGGSSAVGFTRGGDSLVLTTTPAGKRTTYSLYGLLRAGGD